MAEQVYNLRSNEIPKRFHGSSIRIQTPDVVAGDLNATLDNILRFCDPSGDPAQVILDSFNGQAYQLDVQKAIKDYLASDEVKEMSLEEALAGAQELANAHRYGVKAKRAGGDPAKAKQRSARTVAKEASIQVNSYDQLLSDPNLDEATKAIIRQRRDEAFQKQTAAEAEAKAASDTKAAEPEAPAKQGKAKK